MKKIFILFLLLPFFAAAQEKSLLVEGVSPSLYLIHIVAPKENYYSIGRIYNVSPKDIAPFNKLKLESGLSLGQLIKIPLNSSNFTQEGNAAADETFVPLYYKLKDKEGLYRVAKNHHDLPLETLKQWNNIKGDAVKTGTQLIVGYLKVKTELSALAKNGKTAIVAEIKPAPAETKVKETEIVNMPVVEKQTAKAKESKKEKGAAVKTVARDTKLNPTPANEAPVTESPKTVTGKNTGGAGFKDLYDQQQKNAEMKETTGSAGVFKSTSGWTDNKYYCLFNNASAGTVIKIANPVNGKVVFAKVLDSIPDIKLNEGLAIVISNAAADALGVTEVNFNCTINYTK
jgi:LysM repeat protein